MQVNIGALRSKVHNSALHRLGLCADVRVTISEPAFDLYQWTVTECMQSSLVRRLGNIGSRGRQVLLGGGTSVLRVYTHQRYPCFCTGDL